MGKPFSISLIGVGPMAALHAETIKQMDGLELVSCVSRNREKADVFAGQHEIPSARVLDDILSLPEADALWVVVPAQVMDEVAITLSGLSLPMFLEKPVGLDRASTEKVRDTISVPNMVGLNRRFYEIIAEGRRLIAEAGGLKSIEVHMPEDVGRIPEKHASTTRKQWQFANSIHLIDLFRFFGGEVSAVKCANLVRSETDRSYNAILEFTNGARGHFNAQWYAPGGWRVVVCAQDLSITFQPIERALVHYRGKEPVPLLPSGHDRNLKPGLFGQASAFAEMLATGSLPVPGADLDDYFRSVQLVEALTRTKATDVAVV